MKQMENGKFSKDYTADLKTALDLLDEYNEKKEKDMPTAIEAFSAVQKFIRSTRLNKTPIRLLNIPRGGRPCNYMPSFVIFLPFLELFWPPDTETTLLHAVLSFKMFNVSYNIDDYLEGAVSLMVVEKNLGLDDLSMNPKLLAYAKRLHDGCVPEVLKRWV